jgi:hypothetical protein
VGLRPEEFWSMTFAEVDLACEGYERRMDKLIRMPRLAAAILINVNRKRGAAVVNPEDLMPLYFDKMRSIKLMTLEEFERQKEINKHVIWQGQN